MLDRGRLSEVVKLLTISGGSDPFATDYQDRNIFQLSVDLSDFRWLCQQEADQIASMSHEDLCDLTRSLCCFDLPFKVSTLLQYRRPSRENAELPVLMDTLKGPSFGGVLNHLSRWWVLGAKIPGYGDDWDQFISCMISACSDVHFSMDYRSRYTLFSEIISFSLTTFYHGYNVNVTRIIRRWLTFLVQGGVDLLTYGEKEIALHQDGETDWEFKILDFFTGRYLRCILRHIKIGPKPEDWSLIFEDLYVCNNIVNRFFRLVEDDRLDLEYLPDDLGYHKYDSDDSDDGNESDTEDDGTTDMPGSWKD